MPITLRNCFDFLMLSLGIAHAQVSASINDDTDDLSFTLGSGGCSLSPAKGFDYTLLLLLIMSAVLVFIKYPTHNRKRLFV